MVMTLMWVLGAELRPVRAVVLLTVESSPQPHIISFYILYLYLTYCDDLPILIKVFYNAFSVCINACCIHNLLTTFGDLGYFQLLLLKKKHHHQQTVLQQPFLRLTAESLIISIGQVSRRITGAFYIWVFRVFIANQLWLENTGKNRTGTEHV